MNVDALDDVARLRQLWTLAIEPVLGRGDALLVVRVAENSMPRPELERLGRLLGEAAQRSIAMPSVYAQLRRRALAVLHDVLALADRDYVKVTASIHHANRAHLRAVAERLNVAAGMPR